MNKDEFISRAEILLAIKNKQIKNANIQSEEDASVYQTEDQLIYKELMLLFREFKDKNE